MIEFLQWAGTYLAFIPWLFLGILIVVLYWSGKENTGY